MRPRAAPPASNAAANRQNREIPSCATILAQRPGAAQSLSKLQAGHTLFAAKRLSCRSVNSDAASSRLPHRPVWRRRAATRVRRGTIQFRAGSGVRTRAPARHPHPHTRCLCLCPTDLRGPGHRADLPGPLGRPAPGQLRVHPRQFPDFDGGHLQPLVREGLPADGPRTGASAQCRRGGLRRAHGSAGPARDADASAGPAAGPDVSAGIPLTRGGAVCRFDSRGVRDLGCVLPSAAGDGRPHACIRAPEPDRRNVGRALHRPLVAHILH